MASRSTLPSDPEILLDIMHDLPDESDSDDDFDGYLEPEDDPIAYHNSLELEEVEIIRRSQSLQDLSEQEQRQELQSESPLMGLSHSHPLMEGQHASWSPLAGGSPTHAAASSNSTQAQVI